MRFSENARWPVLRLRTSNHATGPEASARPAARLRRGAQDLLDARVAFAVGGARASLTAVSSPVSAAFERFR